MVTTSGARASFPPNASHRRAHCAASNRRTLGNQRNDQYPSIYLSTSRDNRLRHPHIEISYCRPVSCLNERAFRRRTFVRDDRGRNREAAKSPARKLVETGRHSL